MGDRSNLERDIEDDLINFVDRHPILKKAAEKERLKAARLAASVIARLAAPDDG
jgi:hypothetical protein